jgi:hypothetical protein
MVYLKLPFTSEGDIMRHIITLFLLVFSVTVLYGQLTPVKLHDWKHEGVLANGNWTISADSTSVRQSNNDEPTFFVSPDTFANVTIRGSFYVDSGDDDYIGFVFGYLRPDGAEEYFDFYLLDWKGVTQAGAQEGFTLSKVQGIVDVGSGTNTSHPYWDHMDTTQTVLGTYYGDYGWARNVVYNFELIYESNRVRISIDTTEIFDISGDFRPGRFGFYNYSQPGVNYQEFRLNEAPVAVDDAVVTPEDSMVTIHPTQNDSDADGHDLIITKVGESVHGVVNFTEGDSLIYYTPPANFFGMDSFYYHISDGNNSSDSAKVVITVKSVNDPPLRVALIPDRTIEANSSDIFQAAINAYFSDVDENDTFLDDISVTSNGNVTAIISSDSLFLSSQNFSGFDTLIVSVADDSGAAASDTFVVEVVDLTDLEDLATTPLKFGLDQNYPNPFNPVTTINYELPITNYVELSIYNLLGQNVATLVSENQPAGKYQVQWDASEFAGGVYYYKIKAGGFTDVKKMMLIK